MKGTPAFKNTPYVDPEAPAPAARITPPHSKSPPDSPSSVKTPKDAYHLSRELRKDAKAGTLTPVQLEASLDELVGFYEETGDAEGAIVRATVAEREDVVCLDAAAASAPPPPPPDESETPGWLRETLSNVLAKVKSPRTSEA